MSKNEEEAQLGNQLLKLITAKWTTQLLSAAAELGIPEALKDAPQDAEQVAERLDTIPSVTYRILRALTAVGIVNEIAPRRFELTPLGHLLRPDVPGSLHSLAGMLGGSWNNRVWEQLATCARKGKSGGEHAFGEHLYDYLDKHKEEFDNFHRAMREGSTAIHAAAVSAYDFSGINTLVDVGGASGRLLGTILAKYKEMRGILFDRPSVEAEAVVELERLGVKERSTFVGGDFFESVPSGGDAYMMTHVVRNWDDKEATALLRNCRKVIPNDGKLLLLDTVLAHEQERDWDKLMDLEMMVSLGGRGRTESEFEHLFTESGFELAKITPTQSMITIVEAKPV